MKNMQTTQRYTLADLEKWDDVARNIDPPIRLGVFGDPVAHSLSPDMQNAALQESGIALRYAPFQILFSAGSATWNLNPTSNQTIISLSANTEVNGLTFNPGVSRFTVTANSGFVLTIGGITNNLGSHRTKAKHMVGKATGHAIPEPTAMGEGE